jgi:hypothetical protein
MKFMEIVFYQALVTLVSKLITLKLMILDSLTITSKDLSTKTKSMHKLTLK